MVGAMIEISGKGLVWPEGWWKDWAVAFLKAREFYLLEGEGDGFYLLEGEGGGGNGGGASKGEKQEGGAGKAGNQVSEQNLGVESTQ